MPITTLRVIQLCLNFISVTMHVVGMYALLSLLPTSRGKTQRMYLINLTAVEICYNVLEFIRGVAELLGHYSPWVDNIQIVSWTGVSFIFYLAMMYIPLDRFALISFNARYKVYWNVRKTKLHVIGTWLFGCTVSVIVCVLRATTGFDWLNVFFPWLYTTMDILVVLVAVTSYICIHRTVRKSKNKVKVARPKESSSSPTGNIPTNDSRCQKRRFTSKPMLLVPVMLIATYILFQLLPNLVYFVAIRMRTNLSDITTTICNIAYGMSHFVDAIIYIFLLKDVRMFLHQKLHVIFRKENERQVQPA